MITITGNSMEEILQTVRDILAAGQDNPTPKKAAAKAEAPKEEPKTVEAPKAAEPAPIPEPTPAPRPAAPAPAPAPKKVTLNDVAKKAGALRSAGRLADLRALLDEFAVKALPELNEEQLQIVNARLEAM